MSFRCRISALVAALILSTAAQAAEPLRICAEPDNLPMSSEAKNSGYEIEVARLLAADLHRPLEIKWVTQRDHSFLRSTIGKGGCDAIMGVPAAMGRLTMTRPWYHTGFYFVTRADRHLAPASFDDPALRSLSIGVPSTGMGDTPAALALTRRGMGGNLRPYSIYAPGALTAAVAAKDIDVALLWGPFAGWLAEGSETPLALSPAPETDGALPLSFDIAIGVKKGNDELKQQLDAALARQQVAIADVLQKWHVPVRKD